MKELLSFSLKFFERENLSWVSKFWLLKLPTVPQYWERLIGFPNIWNMKPSWAVTKYDLAKTDKNNRNTKILGWPVHNKNCEKNLKYSLKSKKKFNPI